MFYLENIYRKSVKGFYILYTITISEMTSNIPSDFSRRLSNVVHNLKKFLVEPDFMMYFPPSWGKCIKLVL